SLTARSSHCSTRRHRTRTVTRLFASAIPTSSAPETYARWQAILLLTWQRAAQSKGLSTHSIKSWILLFRNSGHRAEPTSFRDMDGLAMQVMSRTLYMLLTRFAIVSNT